MNENILKLISHLCDKGFHLEVYKDNFNARYVVVVPIGSKTGDGRLYFENGDVILETRYNQKDIISDYDSIDQIAHIAWVWFLDYQHRGYGPSLDWLPVWKEMGLISEKSVTKNEYVIH